MIEIKNLTKRYGDIVAVNNVSLEVKRGEIFGFLGVNGAGKTTTLKMLAGVLKPTNGEMRLAGHSMSQDPQLAKQLVGYIPDRPYLYNKLTGREFLYFVADLYRVSAEQAEARIDALLSEYGLSEVQDKLVESYSHGMKQRLATCAALVHEPQVLIVDEPMVGLDPHGAKLLKTRFKEYARNGLTILLSTHSLNVAEEVSDRLAIIHKGTIIVTGTLHEIREQTGGVMGGLEAIFLEITSGVI